MNTIIIDVRTPVEFVQGHYPKAINHELDLIVAGNYPNIPFNTPIQVYCRSGGRSSIAKQILEKAGFSNVENIGGYNP